MIIKIEPDIDAMKAAAVEQVKDRHAEMLDKYFGSYTPEERDTFPKQVEWARGYLADQNAEHTANLEEMIPADIRTTLIAASQVPAQVMADKIMAKDADATRLIIIARRTKAEANAAIEATTTPEELETVMAGLPAVEAAAIAEFEATQP